MLGAHVDVRTSKVMGGAPWQFCLLFPLRPFDLGHD